MMANYKTSYFIFIIFFFSSCSKSYIGTYTDVKNNNLYNSEIKIEAKYLTFKASSDMLGTIEQKVAYLKNGNFIITDFRSKDSSKFTINSSLDNDLNGSKIRIFSIIANDTIIPILNVIINDSLKYYYREKNIVLNKIKIDKIQFNDTEYGFFKDTTVYFSKQNKDNVFEINIKLKDEEPILGEKGKIKYLIKGRKLFVFKYDESQKKYIKSNKLYARKKNQPR